jgi:hypothetical protein
LMINVFPLLLDISCFGYCCLEGIDAFDSSARVDFEVSIVEVAGAFVLK